MLGLYDAKRIKTWVNVDKNISKAFCKFRK